MFNPVQTVSALGKHFHIRYGVKSVVILNLKINAVILIVSNKNFEEYQIPDK